jgi:hypothetical protein
MTSGQTADYQITSDNPIDKSKNAFFYSKEWSDIVCHTLKAEMFFLARSEPDILYTVSVFKKGPFKIGYINFPFGISDDQNLNPQLLKDIFHRQQLIIHILIVNTRKKLVTFEEFYKTQLPETSILNFQKHSPDKLKNLKISLRRGHNRGAIIKKAENNERYRQVFMLYQNTLILRGGLQKYSAEYFGKLMQLEENQGATFLAFVENDLVGFLSIVLHQKKAFALHSSYNRQYNRYCVVDMLMEAAVAFAKKQNCTEFNMGASPANQPSLVEFKEKWGGQTSPLYNYEIPLHPIMAPLFKCIRYLVTLANKYRPHIT